MEEQEQTFSLWGYRFHGTYTSPAALASMPGVYVIWCERKSSWKIVDAGESDDVRHSVIHHSRTQCWNSECRGSLRYAAYYAPGMKRAERESIVRKIRKIGRPPCGEKRRLYASPCRESSDSQSQDHDGGQWNAQRQM